MIPLAVPNLGANEQTCVADALRSGYVGPDGPYVKAFEALVASAAGAQWAIATCSGTAALELAVGVLWGFSARGAAIEVPVYAYPAMANVLARNNYDLVFVPGGTGHDEWRYRHKDRPESEIVDCAPAIGEPFPHGATVACYSFAANKTVTCGMGGAVVGNDGVLHEKFRAAAKQGHGLPGLRNVRMANLNAALGCVQLARLSEFRTIKSQVYDRYRDAGLPMLDRGPSRWMATATPPVSVTPQVLAQFKARGIEVRLEPWGGLSLPCSTDLTLFNQERVIDTWHSIFS